MQELSTWIEDQNKLWATRKKNEANSQRGIGRKTEVGQAVFKTKFKFSMIANSFGTLWDSKAVLSSSFFSLKWFEFLEICYWKNSANTEILPSLLFWKSMCFLKIQHDVPFSTISSISFEPDIISCLPLLSLLLLFFFFIVHSICNKLLFKNPNHLSRFTSNS